MVEYGRLFPHALVHRTVGAGFIPARFANHHRGQVGPYPGISMKRLRGRKHIRLPRPVYRKGHAFSITIGTHQRYPWFRLYPALADSGVHLLGDLGASRETALYCWCIMPDHIHFLLQDRDIVDFVRLFKGRMTPKALSIEPGRRLWQRGFYDHALRKAESLEAVALYIWDNPVRAAIVENPTEYAWSGSAVWPGWKEFYGRG